MPYTDHYKATDDTITHLTTIVAGPSNAFMGSRYVGLIAVSAVAAYESALKHIFIDFADKKHSVFGIYVKNKMDRINGRVRHQNIKDDYIKKFGEKYLKRYNKKIINLDKSYLISHGKSIITAYNNIIVWRNEFAHTGSIPTTVTFNEIVESYEMGKELIKCVADTMVR